jgi:hypothetical protein
MAFEEIVGELVMDRLKAIADEATVEQFVSRLELSVIVRAYLCKRFAERFPAEYAAWHGAQTAARPFVPSPADAILPAELKESR